MPTSTELTRPPFSPSSIRPSKMKARVGSEGFSVTIESFWHALATLAKSGLAHSLAPGRKLYSKAVPHDLHAIGVSKIAGLDGADIFVRQVDALDAFIVGGGRHLHTGSA